MIQFMDSFMSCCLSKQSQYVVTHTNRFINFRRAKLGMNYMYKNILEVLLW